MNRPPVPAPPRRTMTPARKRRTMTPARKRRTMTPARKRRIWTARGGLCGECGEPVPMFGPGVRYDHRGVLWITRDDSDEAIWPLHADCDAVKTPGDLRTVAKIKRLIRDADPETRKRSKRPIHSRGFGEAHRSLSHPTKRRGFDGVVRPREAGR